ncbi:hydrogen gas-evolving membrane-bound hydrogenase subunit E [Pedomonas sp. V897]|uniref:hydrogen gas-evolving membrane-bound hydrogenase subunit E n=1 Tax=Pedomonas sp. V897 TaxID=3446482 RepID=UPI003EE33DC3
MLIWLILISFLGSCLAGPVARLAGRSAGWLLALLPAGLFIALIEIAPFMERGWVLGDGRNWAPHLGLYLTFRLDGFSFLMALLITGIGALVVVYSGAYLSERSARDRGRFFTLILLFMTAMLGAVLADNLVVMLVFWEATSILSFLLIGFEGRSGRARRSALMSLYVTATGGLSMLAAILLIGEVLGTYSLGEVRLRAEELAASPLILPILAGVMIGAFTKSAQFPFHFWLPNAMQAPTPASAYLHSATMVKLGIYLLSRFEPVIAAVPGGRWTLVTVGGATMVTAAVQVLRAEGFKTALAYSTIASLGILVTLIGLTGPAASVAIVGFLLAHALYKAALFFCAGSVLHATGLQNLRAMGDLFRFLPVTGFATLLASLSMAGLPPFFGFISKEFLFQAQLESTSALVSLTIIVLVNAVMVGVAAVITLRPFFLGRGKISEVQHGETPGLVMPPLVLALAGLFLSLDPAWMSNNVLRPAAVAVYGEAIEVKVQLWHGITPMLLLSFVVVLIGALIAFYWRAIHTQLRKSPFFSVIDFDRFFEQSLDLLNRFSAATTRLIQHGDLRGYMAVVVIAVVAFVLYTWGAAGLLPRLPHVEAPEPAAAVVAMTGMAGAIAATRARGLITSMIAVGLAGFAVAVGFLLNGAPDLALTQFTVEALIVVLLTALLLAVPLAAPSMRGRGERRRDALVAVGVGVVLFVALVDMTSATHPGFISQFFGDHSYLSAKGHNVVNVILVDFRGFDTMGETVVIAMAAILAWSLLGIRVPPPQGLRERESPFILRKTAPMFFWLLLATSLWIFLRGHDAPGGGFIGGLVAALAFAMIALAHGVERAQRALRLHPVVLVGIGIVLVLLAGLSGMAAGGAFLQHLWYEGNLAGLPVKVSTTLVFDLGVYVVVLGSVLAFLFGLQRGAER